VIAAVVLAAGRARRMGRPKLLLPLEGRPLVRHAVEAVRPHVDEVVVVVGPDTPELEAALRGPGVRLIRNPRPEDGQGTSIAVGVSALPPGTEAVLIALGDQPRLPAGVVPALLAAWRRSGKAIAAPTYRGVQGTPVLFGAPVFDELRALRGDTGARSVVAARPERVAYVTVDAPMPPDVDTPEDYARLHVE
jgi:molybdenum cofactor cytidylyltransferase